MSIYKFVLYRSLGMAQEFFRPSHDWLKFSDAVKVPIFQTRKILLYCWYFSSKFQGIFFII